MVYGLDPPDSPFKNKSNPENPCYLCIEASIFLQTQVAVNKNSKQSLWNLKVFPHIALATFQKFQIGP
jgi:hypothetical protein